ncbi:hypothetical protein NP233_g10437 [Leucocoprinus birnbaumii]|uniref:Citrate transporter-like domain-containing protein n=1 Tax=Leucocoprinus birnbaumii TaxID=56174 RepID=A0AAD5YRV7_9AGAR|nr:hypothetical protein NP233_g10437 [Leucocoprinus birnbaumii]
MVLFTGNPVNFVICETFKISNSVFSVYTISPFVICSAICLTALMLQFKDARFIPFQLTIPRWSNLQNNLQDATTTLFGSFLLCSSFVVALFLSVQHIGVWKIFLSFACLKFIIDMLWDHRRVVTAPYDFPLLLTTSTSIPVNAAEVDQWETRPTASEEGDEVETSDDQQRVILNLYRSLALRFPTFFAAVPQLPFGLIPLVFSQFILIEALAYHGWIELFGRWLSTASNGDMYRAIWVVGLTGAFLCNIAGTNIGATILMTKVIRQANFNDNSERAAAIALAVVGNIGAINLTLASSRSAYLWRAGLQREEVDVNPWLLAKWNSVILLAMTCMGLAIVCVEMAVLK